MQQIGTHYSTLGPLLLNDNTGTITSSITSEHQKNAEAINQEILKRWLQGQGKNPVVWLTLLDALDHSGLSKLADIIRERFDLVAQMRGQIQALTKKNAELQHQLDMKENTIRKLQEQETRMQCQLRQVI